MQPLAQTTLNAPPQQHSQYPPGLDSGEYIPCNDEICPFIDESDFSAQIFKDVAIIRGLSPEGTPVNLDKFHYMVTEGEIDKNTNDFCSAVGFDHENSFDKLINSISVFMIYVSIMLEIVKELYILVK